MNILIVDDVEAMRELLGTASSADNHDVSFAKGILGKWRRWNVC